MQILIRLKTLAWCFILLLAAPAVAEEKQVITFHSQPVLENNNLSLQWWANGLTDQTVTKAELLVDGRHATAQTSLEPVREKAVCYMLMVDSSKSMKAFFKDNSIKQLLTSLIERKPETHYLGIALFAEEWQLLSNPTQDKAALKATLPQIESAGDRTELLRFTLSALESLQTCPSTSYRKVLLILTDGDAEDRAYTPESIMQTARDKKIGVYGFGFKESAALQFPRRMAEETGGTFVEPATHIGLKRDTAVDAFYMGSNSGGDLKATLPKLNAGQQVQLHLTLSNGQNLTQMVPLSLEPEAALNGWKQEIILVLPWLTPKQVDYVLWGLGLLLLSLLGWFISRRLRQPTIPVEAPRDPVGFLMRHGQTFPIYSGINSVGFLPTNNIVIDHDTVGRTHATLHYQGDGDVVLTDLNSLNGSYVNHNRIQRPTNVHDGDFITLGEWQALYQRAEQDKR